MTLCLTIRPAGLTCRGQAFTAFLDDRPLATSLSPYFDAARVLLAEGVPPETILKLDPQAPGYSVGEAAALSIRDDARRGLRKAPYRPHPRGCAPEGPPTAAMTFAAPE